MKLNIIAITLTALLCANSANAFINKSGTVTAVDVANKTFEVTNKQGRSELFRLADHAKVVVNGQELGMEALAPLQQVTISVPATAVETVKGKIVKINLVSGDAVIQPSGSAKAVTIRLAKNTKVAGKINSYNELAEGQTIEVRYAKN